MNRLTFSFILVNWNTKELTLQCIRSIIEDCNDKFSYEIIVTDNASTDGSADAIESTFPTVNVLRNPDNSGFARGNNIAIEQSKGEYVVLVNTDVIIIKGCMKTLYSYMMNHSETGMVVPRVLNRDGTIQSTIRKEVTLFRSVLRTVWLDALIPAFAEYSHKKLERVESAAGCFFMLKREVIEQVGLLDTDFFFYGEDRDYCKRLKHLNWYIMFIPNARIYHLNGSSSTGKQVKYEILMEVAALQYWKKHHLSSFETYLRLRLLYHAIRLVVNFILYRISFGCLSKVQNQPKYISNWYVFLLLVRKFDRLPPEYSSMIQKQLKVIFPN